MEDAPKYTAHDLATKAITKNERKYFDSGDYAMLKAGNDNIELGSDHPTSGSIKHSPTQNSSLKAVLDDNKEEAE